MVVGGEILMEYNTSLIYYINKPVNSHLGCQTKDYSQQDTKF